MRQLTVFYTVAARPYDVHHDTEILDVEPLLQVGASELVKRVEPTSKLGQDQPTVFFFTSR